MLLTIVSGCTGNRTSLALACTVEQDSLLSGRLLFSVGEYYVLKIETCQTNTIEIPGERPWSGRWSPDGQQLALHISNGGSSHQGDIAIFDLKTSQIATLASRIWFADTPDWSPDGKWLAFMTGWGGGLPAQLFIMRTDGSEQHVILSCADSACECARWSPDGRRIAFSSTNGLEVVDVTGDNRQVLYSKEKVGRILWLDWSPDNSTLAFIGAERRSIVNLLTLSNMKARLIPIANLSLSEGIAWSPTSDQLAVIGSFSSNANKFEDRLVVIDTQGHQLMNIALNNTFQAWSVDWGP
jgi:WD40 repeat protein